MAFPTRGREALQALLDDTFARAPVDLDGEDVWLFAYGSMLEDPPFAADDRRIADLHGFERSFCLADPKLRGSPSHPGLTLGLRPGGGCRGLGWRLGRGRARADIAGLWKSEMQLPFYTSAWLPIAFGGTRNGARALVLLADRASPLFEPDLPESRVVERLATCHGEKGANADYLFETAAALRRADIPDPHLDRLAERVQARRNSSRSIGLRDQA